MKCSKCGHEIRETAKFCEECGTDLQSTQSPFDFKSELTKTKGVSEAERKHVTAMFSDLSGYTAMTERLDPEQVKEITGRVFAGVKEIVAKYEGFIDRLLGDGVLVFFGLPRAHEDDPIRAIRAALEIHQFVQGLSPKYETRIGAPLAMHSGINTGLVVTAEVDLEKGSQGVTGEAVNLASRLSGLAGSGEILFGEETARRSRGLFDFQDLGRKRVKGKAELISVYKLISDKALPAGLDRQVSSIMVGREQELNRLELQVIKVINGEGSVINVIGEAGIGKSRLLAELRRGEVMKKVTLLEGRAISIGKNFSFHPVIDLLKQWASILEEDSDGVGFEKLDRAIKEIHPKEADEILPFVATLMGMKLKSKHAKRVEGIEGEALEKLIFKNVKELIIKVSEQRPLVFVMEDLHWADASSLALLESLYRLVEKHRLLFINVFRPGYWEGGERTVEKISELLPHQYNEIVIQPLDHQASQALIGNMLDIKGLPQSLRLQIVERSGGNPFFIEEVVRSLIDEGAIIREGGSFTVTEKINTVVIPPTINDVLVARIDRLEERTRDLVKMASVIGRNFFDRVLKDVAAAIDDIDKKLTHLKGLQIIKDRIRMEELEYVFKHALAQEAAYESILIQQRRTLHLKVAQSIEWVFQKKLYEFYGMLAYHYGKGEDLEKAEEYMVKAGEEAFRASASSEALYYYQEGLRLYLDRFGQAAESSKLANFEKNIAIALHNKAHWSEAVKYFENVLIRLGAPLPKKGPMAIARLIGDLLIMIKGLYWGHFKSMKATDETDNEILDLYYRTVMGLSYIDNLRQFIVAMAAVRRVIKTGHATLPTGWNLWVGLSGFFSGGGLSFKLSNKLLEASQIMRGPDTIGGRIQYACISTINDHCQGTWAKIKKLDDDLLKSSIKIGDFWHSSAYLWFLGLVKAEQGDFEELQKVIEVLFDIGEDYDYSPASVYARVLKTYYLVTTRSISDGLVEADQGISYTQEKSTELHEIVFLALKTEAEIHLNELERAKETLSQAREIFDRQKLILIFFGAPYLLARLVANVHLLKQENCSEISLNAALIRKQAYQAGKAAVRNSRKYAPYRTKIFRLMGLYYWLIDQQRNAFKWWDKSIKEGERLGARPELSRTYMEVGKRLLEPRSKFKELNGLSAREYLEKAESLFKDMDLEWDLEQLEWVQTGK